MKLFSLFAIQRSKTEGTGFDILTFETEHSFYSFLLIAKVDGTWLFDFLWLGNLFDLIRKR